jgi:hypothetical protein
MLVMLRSQLSTRTTSDETESGRLRKPHKIIKKGALRYPGDWTAERVYHQGFWQTDVHE